MIEEGKGRREGMRKRKRSKGGEGGKGKEGKEEGRRRPLCPQLQLLNPSVVKMNVDHRDSTQLDSTSRQV